MQAATTVRGTGISRSAAGFVAALAAAMLVGGLGGFAAKAWSGQLPAASNTHLSVTAVHGRSAGLLDRNAERVQPALNVPKEIPGRQFGVPDATFDPKAAVSVPVEIPGRQFGVPQATYVPGSEYAIPELTSGPGGGRAIRAHVS